MTPVSVKHLLKLSLLASCQSFASVSAGAAQQSAADTTDLFTTTTPESAFVNTADLASDTAEEIITDVPSVYFWSRFQRGEINGYRYVLFPDGSAKVYSRENPQTVVASMRCAWAVSCQITRANAPTLDVPAIGANRPDIPPVDANGTATAVYLAEWVLAGSGTPPPPPPIEIEDETIVDVALNLDNTAPPVSDGSQSDTALGIFDDSTANPVEQSEDGVDQTEDVAPAPGEEALVEDDAQLTEEDQILVNALDTVPPEDEVCPEQGQFMPTTCAQPTVIVARQEPATSPAPAAAASIPNAPVLQGGIDAAPAPSIETTSDEPDLSFSERYKLRCSVTGSANLNYENSGDGPFSPGKPRASLGCSVAFTEKLSMRASLIGYVFPEQQEDYNPDFTYAFTYKVNDTINLGYANYSARFNGPDGGFFDSLIDGNLRASFRLPKLELPNEKVVACSASLKLPNPFEASGNLSCGYTVNSKIRIGATAYFYLPDVQSQYQPDYSYTASYKFAEDWLLSYSNYANNRWPWNPSGNPNPGIGGGSLAVSYSFNF